jgi:hypothetical protein
MQIGRLQTWEMVMMVMQASIISFPMIQNTTKKQGIKQSWGARRVNKNKGNLCKENV